MATRFYLPSTGAAAVSPAYAAWNNTAEAASRLKCVTTRISSAMANVSVFDDAYSADYSRLWRQYVSDPIGAQTVIGTVKGQVRVYSDTAGMNHDRVSLCIKVVSNDGTTLRGTLLALGYYGATNEYALSLTNRTLANDDALSSVVASDDDRIVIEIGTQPSVAPGDEGLVYASFGDNSGTDLAEDETATAANNAWVEFSGDLFTSNQTSTPSAVESGGATLAGGLMAGVIANASVGAALAGGLVIGALAVDCVGLASGPNSVKYSVLVADSAGSAVAPESAGVVADSYSPTADTSIGAAPMVLRPTTPASIGDQNTATGIQTSADGPLVGTLTLDATALAQPGASTDPISYIVLHAIMVGTDIAWGGIAYESPTNPLFRLKIAGQSLLTHALAVGGAFPLPESPPSVVSKWESINIALRPQGGAWTWADLATVDVLGVRGDYDLLTNEGSDMRAAEMWIEAFGPQGSFVTPLAARLKCGNLQRRLSVAETFGL